MKAIDVFCGAGGLSLGLEMAGFEVIAGIEINPDAVSAYKMNFKHKVYDVDVRKFKFDDVADELGIKRGELDLLAGCPPCQGFSTHKTRNRTGIVDDERNNLVFEFLRLIEEFLPISVMMENVPGLAKDFRIELVKEKLVELGYFIDDGSIQVKDASNYGVPQRRKRMILQASRLGYINEPKKIEDPVTVRDTIGALDECGISGDPLHDLKENRSEKVRKLISLVPKNGGSRKDLPREYWLPCHIRRPDSYRDVYGRMSWDKVAPTITSGCTNPSKGRYIHPVEDRAITLREAALLQSFPISYKFPISLSKEKVALMIGNALPPKFIFEHAKEIHKHIKHSRGKG